MRRSLAVLLLVAGAFAGMAAFGDARPPGSTDDIRARLKPFGAVCKAGDTCGAPAAAATGTGLAADKIYGQFCVACHDSGAAGAPKLGDAVAWAPRVAQGMELLISQAINGKGGMPARGTCMNCTDDEVGATVQYIVDKSK